MYPIFNRNRLSIRPLASRQSKSDTSCMLDPEAVPPPISSESEAILDRLVKQMQQAKKQGAPIVVSYGAHLFKNGLAPVLIRLMEAGYVQHLTTNGAGTIHDWEMAFQGKTEEDVERYIKEGQFGIWQETGLYLNLAIILGSSQGLGYGTSIGKMIHEDGLELPEISDLRKSLQAEFNKNSVSEQLVAQANLLRTLEQFNLSSGKMVIEHPFKQFSIQEAAYRLKIPFSVCPGIGYDIIYSHPINNGAAIGDASVRDFLTFAHTVSQLEHGVFLSVGSAVMSPMTFEKAISMARNLALQEKRSLENYYIVVNDIQPGSWNWSEGEPPKDHPAYYLRFCKSFSRMGGEFQYLELDNTLLLRHLFHRLCQ